MMVMRACHPMHRDKLKQAQQMFNPEMMKKYSELGMKVQALQQELAQTEIECATKDGGVVIKVTGTQVPMDVVVSEDLAGSGLDNVNAELTSALKSAHAKSGNYARERMAALYEEMGVAAGLGGEGGGMPGV
jgi:DNA-binding protein YbaB